MLGAESKNIPQIRKPLSTQGMPNFTGKTEVMMTIAVHSKQNYTSNTATEMANAIGLGKSTGNHGFNHAAAEALCSLAGPKFMRTPVVVLVLVHM